MSAVVTVIQLIWWCEQPMQQVSDHLALCDKSFDIPDPLPLMNNNNNSIIGFNLFYLYFWYAVTHAYHPSTLSKTKLKSKPQLGSLRAE